MTDNAKAAVSVYRRRTMWARRTRSYPVGRDHRMILSYILLLFNLAYLKYKTKAISSSQKAERPKRTTEQRSRRIVTIRRLRCFCVLWRAAVPVFPLFG